MRRNKAKNSGLVPFHSRTLVLGMPGTEESSSSPPPGSDDESDQEDRSFSQPADQLAKELTVARALVFRDRALQEHHIKIEGAEHCMAEEGNVFVDGTSAMAMVTKESRDKEYEASKVLEISESSLTWYLKGGEAYFWCTRTWHSVTIGAKGGEVSAPSRSLRNTSSVAKGPTYKVGDKVLVPVPGASDFVMCQVTAICVVLPKKETALEDALLNESQRENGPPKEFLDTFQGHEGQVKTAMVFLHLSHEKLSHEDLKVKFEGLQWDPEEGDEDEIPRPIAVVRLISNSDLIFCNLSHICLLCSSVPMPRSQKVFGTSNENASSKLEQLVVTEVHVVSDKWSNIHAILSNDWPSQIKSGHADWQGMVDRCNRIYDECVKEDSFSATSLEIFLEIYCSYDYKCAALRVEDFVEAMLLAPFQFLQDFSTSPVFSKEEVNKIMSQRKSTRKRSMDAA